MSKNSNNLAVYNNDYHGHWRASANEGMPYSDDFPEPILVLPEWIDGALGAGNASNIGIKFDLTHPKQCILTVSDDGKGLVSEKRMKDWTSKDVGNIETENIYGHGSKKVLTKFAPDFSTAKWSLQWRKQDRRGLSGVLNTLVSPFNGLETKHIEDDEDVLTCSDRGTQWTVMFDISVLGNLSKPSDLMVALQELIRVRYEPSAYQPYTINTSVVDGSSVWRERSTDWMSLKSCLDAEIAKGKDRVVKTHEITQTIDNTTVTCDFYQIVADGRSFNIPGLPLFGKRNMNASRVHIARNGRYIEAMPYAKFMGKEIHNSDNGKIGFIVFSGDELPTPCTTKVKMQEECPIFKKMKTFVVKHINTPKPSVPAPKPVSNPVSKTSVPAPKTVVAPKPISKPVSKPSVPALNPQVASKPITSNPVVAPKQEIVASSIFQMVVEHASPPPASDLTSSATPDIVLTTLTDEDRIVLCALSSKYGSALLVKALNDANME